MIGLYVCRLGSFPNGTGLMVEYVVSFQSSGSLTLSHTLHEQLGLSRAH